VPDVVVIGAGPVGLLLSGELTRRGVDVALLERRPGAGGGSRAIGVHAPVLAALEASGVTDRLLGSAVRVARGEARSSGRLVGVVRFDRLNMRFPFVATLPQPETERALGADAPPARRGVTVTGVSQESLRIRVDLAHGDPVGAPIVVIAAGWSARALAYRRTAAHTYRDRYLMADAAVPARADAEVAVVNLDRSGVLESFPLPGGRRRFVTWDDAPGDDAPVARADRLRRALRLRGEDDAATAITEASAFPVRRFVAPALRRRGLFVIGDAAHEVSPIGGQGMNLGLLDAATLAPLLAEWVRSGSAPDASLERWERNRVASARWAARLASVNTALGRPLGPLRDAARRALLGVMLAPPAGAAFARAYAMGLDRDA
jgi:2-polyprenyl-6-methoxyphenol hydroxylase-like FAD-dependent oxidoreductase